MKALSLIYLSLILLSPSLGAQSQLSGQALQLARSGWQLRKTIERFYRKEPHLHRNRRFGDIQNWTIENQSYYHRHGQIFRQIIVTDPRYVSMDLIKRAYQKYLIKLNVLVQELPENIELHIEMIEDEKFKNETIAETKQTLNGIANNSIRNWTMTCDYIAQPILTTWYLSVALEHLDKLGRLKQGPQWTNYVNQILTRHRFLSLNQIRNQLSSY